jgi:hypothetical protein
MKIRTSLNYGKEHITGSVGDPDPVESRHLMDPDQKLPPTDPDLNPTLIIDI